MKLIAAMLCFEVDKEVTLAPLLERGYSTPTEADPRARKEYPRGAAAIERRVGATIDNAFVEIRGCTLDDLLNVQVDVMIDLTQAGLYIE